MERSSEVCRRKRRSAASGPPREGGGQVAAPHLMGAGVLQGQAELLDLDGFLRPQLAQRLQRLWPPVALS